MSGNPDYDQYIHARVTQDYGNKVARLKAEQESRFLDSEQINALHLIEQRYDRRYNVTKQSLPVMYQKHVDTLEGKGYIRVEPDGRIVPSFVFQEHGKPIFRTQEHYARRARLADNGVNRLREKRRTLDGLSKGRGSPKRLRA